ncbi:putative F420-0 ABC transporter substrate-binding protein [Microbacterium sp.]|uniref:putative F420-0 ABC transporter substrate-binding protein n=1 Tax=Microbacterium sp. TaxID=51671 RepID=UPI003A85CD2A
MPSFTRRAAAAASLASLALLGGCAGGPSVAAPPTADPVAETIDNCGTPVVVPAESPSRIVTVKSSAFELLLALGVGDRIVGTAFLDGPVPAAYEAEAAEVPVLSEKAPSQEAVLDLEPDLVYAGWESVFSADGAGERADLERLGVTTYVAAAACREPEYRPDPLTFDQVFAEFDEVARLLGQPGLADSLIDEQRTQLTELLPNGEGLRAVWYSSGRDQPYVGAGIGAPEMIMAQAGLTNVFADVDDSWTSTSWEEVADRDPDVIVLVDSTWNSADEKIQLLKDNPVTSTLDAVRADRFVVVDFAATEAGIRNVEAVASIIDQLDDR